MPPRRPVSEKEVTPFSAADYKIDEKTLVFGELLGRGNFSKVFKGTNNGQMAAIKKCEITDEALLKYIQNELAILKRVDHPGIIGFMGACIPMKKKEKDFVYIGE